MSSQASAKRTRFVIRHGVSVSFDSIDNEIGRLIARIAIVHATRQTRYISSEKKLLFHVICESFNGTVTPEKIRAD